MLKSVMPYALTSNLHTGPVKMLKSVMYFACFYYTKIICRTRSDFDNFHALTFLMFYQLLAHVENFLEF